MLHAAIELEREGSERYFIYLSSNFYLLSIYCGQTLHICLCDAYYMQPKIRQNLKTMTYVQYVPRTHICLDRRRRNIPQRTVVAPIGK